jgi:hypothetical protein
MFTSQRLTGNICSRRNQTVRELNDDERQYQKVLAEAGGFTPEDLARCRMGIITERFYPRDHRSSFLVGFGMALTAGLVLIYVTYVAWGQGDYRWPGLLISAVVLLGTAGLFLRARLKMTPETLRERDEITYVDSIEGIPLKVYDSGAPSGPISSAIWDLLDFDIRADDYWYEFENGFRMSVAPRLYGATIEFHPLRVYHKKGSNKILSVEVLPSSWSPRQGSSVGSVIAQKSWHE